MLRKVLYQPRPHTVQVLRRYLLAGYDVELLSPRGNGGTSFLREFLTEIREHGHAALLLPEVGEERPLPSALLAALSEHGRAVPASAMSSPAELASHMERAYGGRPLTLLVDGPQALPPMLRAAVAHYRLVAPVQIALLTDRETPAAVRAPQAVSVHLPMLTLEELGAVLNGACGAPLDAQSVSRVYAKSAGLVKLALAISEVGIIEGQLKMIDGNWVAVQDLWSNRLLPIVRSYAQLEEPADVDALELLSVAGLVSATEALTLVGEAQLERLERSRVVSIEPSGTRHWVTVTPPILGEMYRHSRSPMRLARVAGRIEEVTSRRLGAQDPPQRQIRVSPVNPLLLRRVAAQRAATMHEAKSGWEEQPSGSTGVRYVQTMIDQHAPAQETLRVISAALDTEPAREDRAWLRIWQARVHAHQLGDLQRALAILDGETELAQYQGLIVAARIRLCSDLDVIPPDAEKQLADLNGLPLSVQAEMRRVLVGVHYVRGHLSLAEATLTEALGEGSAGPQDRLRVYEALIALEQGRYERAMRLATLGFERAKDELDGMMMRSFVYVLSLLIVVRGQGVSIAKYTELVAALGDVPVFPQGAYLGIRVCGILSVTASADELRGLVRALDRVDLPSSTLPGTSREWAEAKLAAADGEPGSAAQRCWDDALDLRRRGGYLAAAQAAVHSLQYRFDEVRAHLVTEWLSALESEQLSATLAFLRARAHGNATELQEVIPRLASTGQVGHAMQAYRDLRLLPSVRGNRELADQIAADWEKFSATLENSGLDLLQVVASEAKLTRREEEVARLIAAGLTNRQIQEALVLSIRTVENHVHRLMRKLRVSTRQEVADSVNSWLGHDSRELT
ncbi:helix-turn-helix transcriptional regulator [Leucobacter luti]|uniref:helix-turn-helix transcriptional regulator n=1 Tax=Leucobacter luti TaxID=340320 RepID=UPI00105CAC12|nr:LuxR family transcriptional regulator [Leucobacter luti]